MELLHTLLLLQSIVPCNLFFYENLHIYIHYTFTFALRSMIHLLDLQLTKVTNVNMFKGSKISNNLKEINTMDLHCNDLLWVNRVTLILKTQIVSHIYSLVCVACRK